MTDFPQRPVTVTMSGEEWFAIMVALCHGRDCLSGKGRETYNAAIGKLAGQVGGASDALADGGPRPRRPRLTVHEGGR